MIQIHHTPTLDKEPNKKRPPSASQSSNHQEVNTNA